MVSGNPSSMCARQILDKLVICIKSAVMHEHKNIQVLKMMLEMVRFQTGDKKY